MNYSLILLCAGSGKRTALKYNKIFYKINNQTVYEMNISHFLEDNRCKQIIVVTKENEIDDIRTLVNDSRIEYVFGGKERQDSVYEGLQKVKENHVFIHDGARPYVSKQSINDLVECLKTYDAGLLMVPCKGIVNEPFVIINADDYYGKVAFKKLHDFLIEDSHRNSEFTMAMAGFILKNTLSENGTVTRGICVEDEAGYLHRVIETKGIIRNNQGTIDCDTEESKDIIQENNRVSMNMWAGYPCFIDYLENGFKEFLLDDSGDELTKEYLLPIIVDQLIKTNRASVKVLETTDKWFGVTYPEDKQLVQDSIHELIEQGIYPEKLWK